MLLLLKFRRSALHFAKAVLYAVVFENSSNRKSRKLHFSKLNDYISIKVSEVRFWCAADILIFGIEKLLCQSFNLRIRKVLWKEALKKFGFILLPGHHRITTVCIGEVRGIRCSSDQRWWWFKTWSWNYRVSSNENGPAPNQTCNIADVEVSLSRPVFCQCIVACSYY